MSDERKQCAAITKAGTRCKNKALPGSDYCRVHQHLAQAPGEGPTAPAKPKRKRAARSAKTRSRKGTGQAKASPQAGQPEESAGPQPTPAQKEEFDQLLAELNRLAEELRRLQPDYSPPPFSPQAFLSLLKENIGRFTPSVQMDILQELQRNLQGASPKDLIDPDTWKGLWVIMNCMVQAETSSMREKLVKRLESLPGTALILDLGRNLQGTSPKEFLEPDTWKGMWYILNHTAQLQLQEMRRKLMGDEEEDEEA